MGVSMKFINPCFEIHFFKVGPSKKGTTHIEKILKILMIFTQIFMVEHEFQWSFYQTRIVLNVCILRYIVKLIVTIILNHMIHFTNLIWLSSGSIFCMWMKFGKSVVLPLTATWRTFWTFSNLTELNSSLTKTIANWFNFFHITHSGSNDHNKRIEIRGSVYEIH